MKVLPVFLLRDTLENIRGKYLWDDFMSSWHESKKKLIKGKRLEAIGLKKWHESKKKLIEGKRKLNDNWQLIVDSWKKWHESKRKLVEGWKKLIDRWKLKVKKLKVEGWKLEEVDWR